MKSLKFNQSYTINIVICIFILNLNNFCICQNCPCNNLTLKLPIRCKYEDCGAAVTFEMGKYDLLEDYQDLKIKLERKRAFFNNLTLNIKNTSDFNDKISFLSYGADYGQYMLKDSFKTEIIYSNATTYTWSLLNNWPKGKNGKYLDIFNETSWFIEFGDVKRKHFTKVYFSELPSYHMNFLKCCFYNYGDNNFNVFATYDKSKDMITFYVQPIYSLPKIILKLLDEETKAAIIVDISFDLALISAKLNIGKEIALNSTNFLNFAVVNHKFIKKSHCRWVSPAIINTNVGKYELINKDLLMSISADNKILFENYFYINRDIVFDDVYVSCRVSFILFTLSLLTSVIINKKIFDF